MTKPKNKTDWKGIADRLTPLIGGNGGELLAAAKAEGVKAWFSEKTGQYSAQKSTGKGKPPLTGKSIISQAEAIRTFCNGARRMALKG